MTPTLPPDVLDWISGLSEAEIARLPADLRASISAVLEKETPIWVPQPGPQTEAYYCEADILLYGGQAGGGKAQSLLTDHNVQHIMLTRSIDEREAKMLLENIVVTPSGERRIDDIKVGDRVCSPDGTTSVVLTKSTVHRRPCYRLEFDDGSSVVASDNHLWVVKKSGTALPRKNSPLEDQSKLSPRIRFAVEITTRYSVVTTLDFIRLFEEAKSQEDKGIRPNWPNIPLGEGVEFTRPPGRLFRVPPYTLGVLIGDGSLRGKTPRWTKPDLELGEWIQNELEEFGFSDQVVLKSELNGDFSIIGGDVMHGLRSCGLDGKLSQDKFIPAWYKYSPLNVRLSLVQGLMDTDGYTDSRGQVYWSSSSNLLAKDFQYVLRSLGYKVTMTVKDEPKYTYRGENRIGQPSYQLYITGRNRSQLFRLSRKKGKVRELNHESGKRLVNVTSLGKLDVQCIGLDHPLHLYYTNDFIVTHNTALGIGLALTAHYRTLFVRREGVNNQAAKDEMSAIIGDPTRLNNQSGVFRLDHMRPGQVCHFVGVPNLGDEKKYMGQARDLLILDETASLLEIQARFLMGWVRPAAGAPPGQRCRTLMCSNPPTSSEGLWLIDFFAPWLDPDHPDPADPGELRWFTTINGKDYSVDDGQPRVLDVPGEPETMRLAADAEIAESKRPGTSIEVITPLSRTFIPSAVTDNAFLRDTGYIASLQALPEPLRSQMLYGDFLAGMEDDAYQTIPSAWVDAAMARWKERDQKDAMVSMGVDVSRGGRDATIIARRHAGMWFDRLIEVPPEETIDGPSVGGHIIAHRRNAAPIHIDVIGPGASVYDFLKGNGVQVVPMEGSRASHASDLSGVLGFANLRTELYWRMREALDPANDTGIALPPDKRLKGDLCAPTFAVRSGRIVLETKEKVVAKLGRSPDKGDAVVDALVDTPIRGREYGKLLPQKAVDDFDPYED